MIRICYIDMHFLDNTIVKIIIICYIDMHFLDNIDNTENKDMLY